MNADLPFEIMLAACRTSAERRAVIAHYGRKQAALVKWERGGGLRRALAAYARLHHRPSGMATPTIGGGASAAGKALWVLENLGPMTQEELVTLVAVTPSAVSNALRGLLRLRCVRSERAGSGKLRRWHFVARNPNHKEAV